MVKVVEVLVVFLGYSTVGHKTKVHFNEVTNGHIHISRRDFVYTITADTRLENDRFKTVSRHG